MTNRFILIGLAALLLASSLRADENAGTLAIIVSKNSSMDNISKTDLVKCFRGEKIRDADGNKIVILMREHGSLERAAVLKYIYQMTEQEYQTYFLQATFTGQVIAAPKKLNSAAAMRQFVADNPGSIGCVRFADLDDSVKVLKIDGKAPGNADYELKLK